MLLFAEFMLLIFNSTITSFHISSAFLTITTKNLLNHFYKKNTNKWHYLTSNLWFLRNISQTSCSALHAVIIRCWMTDEAASRGYSHEVL
uniref:Putative secreted protein n=1 Tax=Anopheles marajoara TaxID=58244 RepID=A0A2M4CA84_9DIPT